MKKFISRSRNLLMFVVVKVYLGLIGVKRSGKTEKCSAVFLSERKGEKTLQAECPMPVPEQLR